MKKIYFTLTLLILLSSFAFAQVDYKTQTANQWGCSFAISSFDPMIGTPLQTILIATANAETGRTENLYSVSIIPKYFISNDILLRFEFGITNIQLKLNSELISGSYNYITNTTLNQNIYSYIPGIQWNFLRWKKIEFYCGATLNYINYNDISLTSYGESRQVPTDTLLSWSNGKATTPGGFSLGMGAFTGFNIYMQKHISLGAEFSSSLLYSKIGGTDVSEYTSQNLPSPPVSEPVVYNSDSYKGIQFTNIISSFNITLWF